MPLHLIKGPLNSGRTGQIRALVAERIGSAPLIVAPTADARYELEAELCADTGAVIGPLVTSFFGLARNITRRARVEPAPLASAAQRRHLVAKATARARLDILAESASRAGFTAALERLFGELRAAGVSSDVPVPDDRYLREVLGIYAHYLRELQAAGLTDQAGLIDVAAQALRNDPDSWSARPVFMHGFDDLSRDQLRLVEALAAVAEVTVSITYEDREALKARSRLFGLLEEIGGKVLRSMPPVAAFTPNPLLFHLERHFGETETPPAPPATGLHFLSAASERSEAEAVAVEIKQILAGGTAASQIAVALRTPNRQGPELARAMIRAGIPVALETELSVTATATGQALADLNDAAFGTDGAAALMRLIRGVGITTINADIADWLEWTIRRRRLTGTDEALAELERRHGVSVPEVDGFRRAHAAGPAQVAEWLADFALRAAENAGGDLEIRSAQILAETAADLAPLVAHSSQLVEELLVEELPTWNGPVGERVRVASPYTLRTARFDHLFVCSLQEGEFPRRGSEGPFLSEAQRALLGLPERADTEAEETYLFQVCLSLPRHSLWLSSRTTNADGGAEQPSPFVSQVEALAGESADHKSLGLGDLAPGPERATSEAELALSLLLSKRVTAAEFLPDQGAIERVERQIETAVERQRLASRPRPLRHETVLAELAQVQDFGATSLEAFLRYPYHWFIRHELRPEPLERDDEPLVDGSLAHEVLYQLYRDPPGESPRPTPGDLSAWKQRCGQLLESEAKRSGLSEKFVEDRIRLRRMIGYLHTFLDEEAENADLDLRPAMFEISFGRGDEGPPALHRDGWRLRGTIDRVDLNDAGSQGLLHDYKYSARPRGLPDFESEGVLQLPLYMAALDQIWNIKPLGGLYRPLRARRETTARGLLSSTASEGPLATMRHSPRDVVSEAEMSLLIEESLQRATEVVEAIRAGAIDGIPLPDAFKDVPGWAAIDRRVRNLDDDEVD